MSAVAAEQDTTDDRQPDPPAESGRDQEAGPAAAPKRSRKGIGGPKTAEGKARSARNAIKHGLRATKLLPEDLEAAVAQRREEMTADLRPETPYQEWLIDQAALAAARLDRCAAMAGLDIQRQVERARLCWDNDRRLAAETLGARLAKAPSRVVAALRRTRQGAEWLCARWEALGEALRRHGTWDDAQRQLALDLLGTPPELRSASRLVDENASPEALSALVAAQLAALRALIRDRLAPLDAYERALAVRGLAVEPDGPSRALKRYEATCLRTLCWALQELRRLRPAPPPASADSPPAPAGSTPAPARRVGLPSISLPTTPPWYAAVPTPPRPAPPPAPVRPGPRLPASPPPDQPSPGVPGPATGRAAMAPSAPPASNRRALASQARQRPGGPSR